MKKYVIALITCFIFTASFGQEVKLNEYITKYSDDFKLIGISSKTGKETYEYNRKIERLLLGHDVDVMWVTTKSNRIIAYMYLLEPNHGNMVSSYEIEGVVKIIEKNLGIELKKEHSEKYGVANDDVLMEVSAGKHPISGKERILFYTALTKEL